MSLINTKNVLEKIARENNCMDKYEVSLKSNFNNVGRDIFYCAKLIFFVIEIT